MAARLARFARAACMAAIAVSSVLVCVPAGAATTVLPLSLLEKRVEANLRVKAAQGMLDAADAGVRYQTASSGLQLFVANAFGPRREVLSSDVAGQSLRDTQSFGVSVPLFGASDAQREAQAAAGMRAENARTDLKHVSVSLLALVRASYVTYWSASREMELAHAYGAVLARDAPKTRMLRSLGFWTDADYLRYLDERERAKTDLRQAKFAMRESMALMRGVVGDDLHGFIAEEPMFAKACLGDAPFLEKAALAYDPDVQNLKAQVKRLRMVRKYAKNHSVDASFLASVGTTADTSGTMRNANPWGYDATVGVEFRLPAHAKTADKAYLKEVSSELASYENEEQGREAEVLAVVEKTFDAKDAAQEALTQDLWERRAANEALRETLVRFAGAANTTLGDVQNMRANAYAKARAVLESRSAVLLKAYELLALAPVSCDASIVVKGAGHSSRGKIALKDAARGLNRDR